mmetsp:Transcript_8655/g.11121  ORF Transcript_8655/g.11121 Transcript_8655/m.11121 type:complete len:236 (+) Transcript_8655:2122-2829(+)
MQLCNSPRIITYNPMPLAFVCNVKEINLVTCACIIGVTISTPIFATSSIKKLCQNIPLQKVLISRLHPTFVFFADPMKCFVFSRRYIVKRTCLRHILFKNSFVLNPTAAGRRSCWRWGAGICRFVLSQKVSKNCHDNNNHNNHNSSDNLVFFHLFLLFVQINFFRINYFFIVYNFNGYSELFIGNIIKIFHLKTSVTFKYYALRLCETFRFVQYFAVMYIGCCCYKSLLFIGRIH